MIAEGLTFATSLLDILSRLEVSDIDKRKAAEEYVAARRAFEGSVEGLDEAINAAHARVDAEVARIRGEAERKKREPQPGTAPAQPVTPPAPAPGTG